MQASILQKKNIQLNRNIRTITDVVRVNWFVAWVNWAKVDACSFILCVVVIARFVMYVMRKSRTFAWIFNFLLYSARAEAFNGAED